MKQKYFKDAEGKTIRATEINTAELVADKLSNKKMLETHPAEVLIYRKSNEAIVDRHVLQYSEAIDYGKQAIKAYPELAYKVIQVVE